MLTPWTWILFAAPSVTATATAGSVIAIAVGTRGVVSTTDLPSSMSSQSARSSWAFAAVDRSRRTATATRAFARRSPATRSASRERKVGIRRDPRGEGSGTATRLAQVECPLSVLPLRLFRGGLSALDDGDGAVGTLGAALVPLLDRDPLLVAHAAEERAGERAVRLDVGDVDVVPQRHRDLALRDGVRE